MNRKELLEGILNQKDLKELSKKTAELFLNELLSCIKNNVKDGHDVSLVGFGTFTRTKRAARTGINPSTGAKIQIKAKTVPKFRPGKSFKEFI